MAVNVAEWLVRCEGKRMDERFTALLSDESIGDSSRQPVIWSPGRALGRLERLSLVMEDEHAMSVICQRVADGESLKGIGRSWELPVGRFVEWVVGDAERKAAYEAALRVRADELAHEALAVADGSEPEQVPRDSLRVKTRLALAGLWDRERYGQGGGAGGKVTRVVVDRDCSGGVERVGVEIKET